VKNGRFPERLDRLYFEDVTKKDRNDETGTPVSSATMDVHFSRKLQGCYDARYFGNKFRKGMPVSRHAMVAYRKVDSDARRRKLVRLDFAFVRRGQVDEISHSFLYKLVHVSLLRIAPEKGSFFDEIR
jgi:hypothetical protein